jgi:hypothetical protein
LEFRFILGPADKPFIIIPISFEFIFNGTQNIVSGRVTGILKISSIHNMAPSLMRNIVPHR